MVWHPSQEEFEAVVRLSGELRYVHFIKKVVDEEMVWGLWYNGWAMAGDDSGKQFIPIWPHPVYAEACALDSWKGHHPRSITLTDLLNKWIPGMHTDGLDFAVFPTPKGNGVTISLRELEADIRAKLECYE